MPSNFIEGNPCRWYVREIAIFFPHKALMLRHLFTGVIKSQTIEGLFSSRVLEFFK